MKADNLKVKYKCQEISYKMRTEKEKMLAGDMYMANDQELRDDFFACRHLTRLFNQTKETELEERTKLLKKLLKNTGSEFYIEPPFRCDYGKNISIGENFYANFDCIMLDVANITIGDNVMFAPRVSLFTAGHPLDAEIRNSGLEFGSEIKIGNNVWIGGNTTVNPGVTIGNNVVIGSGSVVTKDIPENSIAAGNPCRVLRDVSDEDKKYWQDKHTMYWEERNHN
ncbi:sugar O-acetyltransferase [Vagococcus fessus]